MDILMDSLIVRSDLMQLFRQDMLLLLPPNTWSQWRVITKLLVGLYKLRSKCDLKFVWNTKHSNFKMAKYDGKYESKYDDKDTSTGMQELVARMRRFYDVDFAQMNNYQTLPRRRKRLSEVNYIEMIWNLPASVHKCVVRQIMLCTCWPSLIRP